MWTIRLMLEARMHEVPSYFVTLTYAKENLPKEGVSPRELQLFCKRLRNYSPFRFYAVGEYGDKTLRPHYHLALFGLQERLPLGRHDEAWVCGGKCIVCRTWEKGLVHVGQLEQHSAGYLASYVTKGMTRPGDARLPVGTHPEFCRMSLKPGIGAEAVRVIAGGVLDERTGELRLEGGDVPGVVRSEARRWPIGRYLRRKLRDAVGMASGTPDELMAMWQRELQGQLRVPGARERREAAREKSVAKMEQQRRNSLLKGSL